MFRSYFKTNVLFKIPTSRFLILFALVKTVTSDYKYRSVENQRYFVHLMLTSKMQRNINSNMR